VGVAVVIRRTGGPDVLEIEAQDRPRPAPGEIVVENEAIGLNFIDIYQRRGLYPLSMPAVLGSEGAGRVVVAGEDAGAFSPGDRVAYLAGGGAYASRAAVAAGMAVRLPETISSDLAAATFLKGLTALMLVRDVHPLKAGETALAYAAAGGVGSLLVPWIKALGVRVIAVVGDEGKAAAAKRLGADAVLLRTKTDSIPAEVRRLTEGRGVDVVYDSVGAATFQASLDSLALRGHMVSYGNASGAAPPIAPLELTRRGSLTLSRPSLFHYATPERLPEMAQTLFSAIASKLLKPAAPRAFPLAHAAEAHALLESAATTGALILKP
jgi:NADPH2:quinone reductase